MMIHSVGDRIAEGTYDVHSRFRRVVNFSDGNRLVSLVDPTVGPGPVNIVAGDIGFQHLQRLRAEPGRIVMDQATQRFGEDARYLSRIVLAETNPRHLRKNTAVLRHTLLSRAPSRSLAVLLDPQRLEAFRPGFERTLIGHLQKGVQRIRAGDLIPGVQMLNGCGFGLTPSGDDYLCGMLIGLHFAEQTRGRNLGEERKIIYGATASDHLLSATFLHLAYEGHVNAAMKGLLNALADEDGNATRNRTTQVIATGATSGADTATGLLMTLEEYL